MLMKIFNVLSILFGGIALGAILTILGCCAVIEKDGYDVGIKKPKETE